MLKTSVNSFFWWRKRFWEVNKSYTTNTLEGLGVVHNNLGGGGGGVVAIFNPVGHSCCNAGQWVGQCIRWCM